jgi:hypothetical protein
MNAPWVVVALLGLVALGAVVWAIASEVHERRRARAAAKIAGRYSNRRSDPPRA